MPDNNDNSPADDQPISDFDSLMNGLGAGVPASTPVEPPTAPTPVPPANVEPDPTPRAQPEPMPEPAVVDDFDDDFDDDGDDEPVEPTVLNISCTPTAPLGGVAAAVELGARVGLLLVESTGVGELGGFAAAVDGTSWQTTYTVANSALSALPAGSVAMCGTLTVGDDINVEVVAVTAGGEDGVDALEAAFAHADAIAAANEVDPTTSFVVSYSKDSDWADPEIAAVVAVSLGEFDGIGFGHLDATPVAEGKEMSVVYSLANPGQRDIRLLGRVVGYGGTQRFPFGEVRATTRA